MLGTLGIEWERDSLSTGGGNLSNTAGCIGYSCQSRAAEKFDIVGESKRTVP
jgi:hypothetical protein